MGADVVGAGGNAFGAHEVGFGFADEGVQLGNVLRVRVGAAREGQNGCEQGCLTHRGIDPVFGRVAARAARGVSTVDRVGQAGQP